MARVGYARVSSAGQSLDIQLDRLKGCDKVFSEKRSGLDGARRELNRCLEYVREGDALVVTKLDRLARSTAHLYTIYETLKRKGVALQVLDQQIDTSTSSGKALLGLLAVIAEFEADIRKERQMEGIAKAKARGVAFGRTAKLSDEQALDLRRKRSEGRLVRDLMAEYGLSKASVYRALSAGNERG